MNKTEVFVDGGSRGNPGPAGGGFAAYRAGKEVFSGSEFFGERTNNQAEYMALRLALSCVYEKYGDAPLQCYMDSELVVRQMNGEYKVKNAELKPLFREVSLIAGQFKSFAIAHVPREKNKRADQLANRAMDRGF